MKEKQNTPIMVANTEWPLPDNLIQDIKTERMINGLLDFANPNVLDEIDLVGWAECVGYLMPASCREVLRSDVAEIYLYCVRKYLEDKQMEIPEIGLPEQLSDYQMETLRDYKRFIYKSRGGKEQTPVLSALKEVFTNPH